MGGKICVICNTEKSIDNVYNKYRDFKQFKNKRSLKRNHENKDKKSNQQTMSYEKNRVRIIQKQNIRYINYKELHRSCVELQNKLKAMEEKLTTNHSENKTNGFKN